MAEITLQRIEQLEIESGPMKHADAVVEVTCGELAELLSVYRAMRHLGEQLRARGSVVLRAPSESSNG